MNKSEALACILKIAIIPAVRTPSPEDALFASETVFSSGIPIVEITLTIPGAINLITQLARSHSSVVVGAGTILDVETARRCVDAGASFLTSTGFDSELVRFANQQNVAVIPGALTPTEVMAAQRAGADLIKLFPCASVGGPNYLRGLRAPFFNSKFVASGGVNQQTAADYIAAGADVLGIGRELLPQEAIKARDASWIHELARRYLTIVKHSRGDKASSQQSSGSF